MTSTIFTVSINNDHTLEKDEKFLLFISSSSIHVADPDQSVVTIVDDDGKLLNIVISNSQLCSKVPSLSSCMSNSVN